MRRPSVFVRPLEPSEAMRLKRMSKSSKHFSTRQRAQILLASETGMGAAEIARVLRADDSHVRKVINAFNEAGFESLVPKYRGGRPRSVAEATAKTVVETAVLPPQVSGVPLTRWSNSPFRQWRGWSRQSDVELRGIPYPEHIQPRRE